MKNKTQLILSHLQKKKKITSWEAIELYGATRLAATIHQLKEYGYEIQTHMVQGEGNIRWAVYQYKGDRYAK